MQKISLQKKSFFNSIGLNIENLPQELNIKASCMQKKLPLKDVEFLNNRYLTTEEQKHFRLKNVIGTTNLDYEDKTWIDILIENEKSDEIIKQYFKNPNYYFRDLRKLDQSNLNHNNEIELYEDNGKLFIKDGVSRLSIMMIKYLLEMSRASSKEERLLINKQYIFAANIRSIPKDRDIMHLINMLIEIYGSKLKIQKSSNDNEYNYIMKYHEKVIEIKSKTELETFIRNSYLPKEYKNMDRLRSKVQNLIKMGMEYKENEDGEESLLVLGRIFPNYEVFVKYYNKIQKYNIEDKLYDELDLDNISYEIILKKLIKIAKREENQIKENKIKNSKKAITEKKSVKKDLEKKDEKLISKKSVIDNEEKKSIKETKQSSKISKNEESNDLQNEKENAINQIQAIIENIEMMYYKLKKEEAEIMNLANSANIDLIIDKMNEDRANANINSIKENSIKIKRTINNENDIVKLKELNETLKKLKKLSIDKNLPIDYAEEMTEIFNKSFNKAALKIISDSKIKKLENEKIEIEKEKCSFFSKLIGKAKLKQAKLDNINLKKQLILSESQYSDKTYYCIEDGLSDMYAYVKTEEDKSVLGDVQLFLRNIESNLQLKNLTDQNKLSRLTKEKVSQQKNLPVLVLSKEKRKLFSKNQINLMEEKNNELKRVIQITRVNSLKKQNTGVLPIFGNIKATKALNKFYSLLNEIDMSLQ